jgi:hypothetical protein
MTIQHIAMLAALAISSAADAAGLRLHRERRLYPQTCDVQRA